MKVRERMFVLIRKYPEGHPVVISLLRQTLELIGQDRQNPSTSAAQKFDLQFIEKYVREIARFILREHLWLTQEDTRFFKNVRDTGGWKLRLMTNQT